MWPKYAPFFIKFVPKNGYFVCFFEKKRKKRAFLMNLLVYSLRNFRKKSIADVFLVCMENILRKTDAGFYGTFFLET